jgi:hypothetical protein
MTNSHGSSRLSKARQRKEAATLRRLTIVFYYIRNVENVEAYIVLAVGRGFLSIANEDVC